MDNFSTRPDGHDDHVAHSKENLTYHDARHGEKHKRHKPNPISYQGGQEVKGQPVQGKMDGVYLMVHGKQCQGWRHVDSE